MLRKQVAPLFQNPWHATVKVFISHAGKPQDDYPSALRSALTEQGLKVLERSFEENAFARVETSCEEADLVIFIVTHNFLQNSICLKELQWVLQHRHESCSKLSRPSIQVLLYPALRGYTKVQLNTMPPRDKQKHMETLERDSLSVDDVLKSATLKQTLQARQQAPVDLLEQLREVCRSHDACPRGDSLAVDSVAMAALVMLKPRIDEVEAELMYAAEDVFISCAGEQKDGFAVHLRQELQRHGLSAFLDERNILPGQQAASRVKAACTGAKLVIFVLTGAFIRSTYCLEELRWTLACRKQSRGRLPEILTVLYPAGADTVSLNDLNPLSREISALPDAKAPPTWWQWLIPSGAPHGELSRVQQSKHDLELLATFCILRHDDFARGDDLLMDAVVLGAKRMLAPHTKCSQVLR